MRHRIKQGFDLRLAGEARKTLPPAGPPATFGVGTAEHGALRWRLLAREDAIVRGGEPVLANREHGDIALVAPLSGRVRSITYGPRRSPLVVELERTDAPPRMEMPPRGDRAALALALQRSGLWPLIRQRPLGRMARPDRAPAAIFINGMDTEPLAADPAILVADRAEELQAGIDLLATLAAGPMFLTLPVAARSSELSSLRGVEVHEFEGPHPSGLPGTHIDRIRPLHEGEVCWTVRAPDVSRIGAWVRTGCFPAERTIAIAGPAAPEPGYRRIWQGAPISDLIGPIGSAVRVIEGTVLGGSASAPGAFLALATHTISVIDEGAGRRLPLGWLRPRFDRPSAAPATLGWLRPRSAYDADARVHGGERAMIDFGLFAKVMPLDVHLAYLIRAIEAGDLDEALALGLLDLTEEDVALCSVVDPCKVDFGAVIRRGLDHYEAERGAA